MTRCQLYAFDILALTVMTCVPLGPVHFTCCGTDCGYKLANDGEDTRAIQDWLGHVSIVHTTRYTAQSPARFKGFLEGFGEPAEPAGAVEQGPV